MSAIKIVKLENGDDIVCAFPKEQLPDKHALLRIERPLQIKYIPQLTPGGFKDYVALIKWAAYTGDTIVTIPKDKIMTITNASSEMQKSYVHLIKDYHLIDKNLQREDEVKLTRERLSDKDNEKINEIFNEFEDEEPTIH
tara:strand:- start:363 stop:782 length:420 start_codon:yes stop_codon:yes gene_type:complete